MGVIPKCSDVPGKLSRPGSNEPSAKGSQKDAKEKRTSTADSEATTTAISPHAPVVDENIDPQAVLQRSFSRMDELAQQHKQNFDDLAELRMQVFGQQHPLPSDDTLEACPAARDDVLEETVCRLNTFLDEQLAHIQISDYDGLVDLEDDVLCEYGAASAQLDEEKSRSVAASWEKWGPDDELKQRIIAAGQEAVGSGPAPIECAALNGEEPCPEAESLEPDVFDINQAKTNDLTRTQLLVKLKEAERKIASLEDALQVATSPPRIDGAASVESTGGLNHTASMLGASVGQTAEEPSVLGTCTEETPEEPEQSHLPEAEVQVDPARDLAAELDSAFDAVHEEGLSRHLQTVTATTASIDANGQACKDHTVEGQLVEAAGRQAGDSMPTALGAQPFGADSLETALDF